MGCLSQLFGILFFAFLFRAVAWLVRELFGGESGGSDAGRTDAPSEAAMRQRLKYVYHLMEVFTWLAGVLLLRRRGKEFAVEMGLSVVAAVLYQLILPHWG